MEYVYTYCNIGVCGCYVLSHSPRSIRLPMAERRQGMKCGRFIIGLLLGLFVFCLSAQSVNKEQKQESKIKTLWVVDGVALNDSVFDYTLEQMQSDSAPLLASHFGDRFCQRSRVRFCQL